MDNLLAMKVLVTPRSYGRHDVHLKTELESKVGEVIYNPYGHSLSSEELQDLLPGVDGYIAGIDTIDRAALERADHLKVIARYGTGVDNVDLKAAKEKAIIVTNTPGANAVSVAELTIGLMLSLARRISEADRMTKRGEWSPISGICLEGKTVGLLGLGAIGKEVACRLQGFGCVVLAYDLLFLKDFALAHGVVPESFENVIQQADFLSLHVPLTPETAGMVDAGFIAKMKSGSFLVNTSRGGIIDEAALLAALETGHLRGAALDTLAEEPPDPGNMLLALPQVIITPHMGAHSDRAANVMGRWALQDCLNVLKGEAPIHRVI